MLKESYSCDICGTPEIVPTSVVYMEVRAFQGSALRPKDTLHICSSCSARWPKGEDFFDWLKVRLKEITRVGFDATKKERADSQFDALREG